MLANALFYGPTPVVEARERCEELRLLEPTHPVVEGNVLCYLGGLAALQGNYDEARELHGRGRGIFEELGHTVGIAGSTTVSGPIELLAGDPAAAERELRFGLRRVRGDGRDRDPLVPGRAARRGGARAGEGRRGREELTRVANRPRPPTTRPRRSPGGRSGLSSSHDAAKSTRRVHLPPRRSRAPPRRLPGDARQRARSAG